MASSKLLGRHKDSPDFDGHFNYRRVIGKLNFLEQSTRGDISYATHMCARFSTCPKLEHGKAVKWIGRYLKKTRKQGFIIRPDPSRGMEVHPDSDFAGAWEPAGAGEDVDTARSRHGFIVSYCGVPLFWKSQMQTEIALSSMEAEFIALATATRAAIPIQRILMEMKERGFPVVVDKNKIHCSVFEDNSGALAFAKLPKTRPRTKHINVKYFPLVELGAWGRSPCRALLLPQDRDRRPTRGCADQAPCLGVVCQAPQVVAWLVSGENLFSFCLFFSLEVFAFLVVIEGLTQRPGAQVPSALCLVLFHVELARFHQEGVLGFGVFSHEWWINLATKQCLVFRLLWEPIISSFRHSLARISSTADKGLILKPIEVTKFKLDKYVDSDFMGKFGKEHPDNPNNVRSRAGHVLLLKAVLSFGRVSCSRASALVQ